MKEKERSEELVNASKELNLLYKEKTTNLERLKRITRSDPNLMMEMLSLYLTQTPALVNSMKDGFKNKDWNTLHRAVHTMIPSFSIVGMNIDFENIAKRVQDFAVSGEHAESVQPLITELENICMKACAELQEEFNTLKNAIS